MKQLTTILKGLTLLEKDLHLDNRGSFQESYNADVYKQYGIPTEWAQDNISVSKQNVLRGLHLQFKNPQGKLVSVLSGDILDVVVDLRRESNTFGETEKIQLSDKNRRILYVPPGFAHGFVVLSPAAMVHYKCTSKYDPSSESGIVWSDPDLDIDWQVLNPIVSSKDRELPTFKEILKRL